MISISQTIDESRKIVVKLGSNVLSTDDGRPNENLIEKIVDDVAALMEKGKQIVVVSSGAGVCGVGAINKWSRRKDMNYKQALCAIGQVELMNKYKEYFAKYGVHVGQILLVGEDFEHPERRLHMRNTLFTLVDEGVVPIINENDTVSIEEFSIGDNDTLSALAGSLWNCDCLIILSDIDGVFDKDPKNNEDARLIELVEDVHELKENIDIKGMSSFGTGGIATKIDAAERIGKFGIPTVLINGKIENAIGKAARGKLRGTLFTGVE